MEYTLQNVDPDDITLDIIPEIEKSFDFKFINLELAGVKTFGDFCDAVSAKVIAKDVDDCTTQQSFYKVRQSVASVTNIDIKTLTPATNLSALFPLRNRRKQIAKVQTALGFKLKILQPKQIFVLLGAGLFITSLITLCFNWHLSIPEMFAAILILKISARLGRQFTVATLGELAKKAAADYYFKVRRMPNTVVRQEIEALIAVRFCEGLGLDKEVLTRDALFA